MRTLVRWDPFAEFRSLRRAVDGFYGPTTWRLHDSALTFPVDVAETDEHLVVKAALPGIKPDDVDISVNDGVLTVKGETKSEETSEAENYHRREIRFGAFYREIPLPAQVNDDKAEAEFTDGVLTVTLPKAEQARPKQIKVKSEVLVSGNGKTGASS